MALRFIVFYRLLGLNELPSHPITAEAVETVIARNEPWYQPGETENDGEIEESIALRVLDMIATNMPAEAPVCFEARLSFDHERLERLMLVPEHKAKRNAALLDIAQRLIPQEAAR